ncbi:MAG TPA: hypothetical protein VFW88_06990 [Burkholderiales bacterium]|nr:hypothetical protein [Burkholderiales bacterium]
MKTMNLVQGTPEWDAYRREHHNASEAPVMMGASEKLSRNDMLRLYATGDEQQFSDYIKNVIFENGHQVEALGRPIAEKIIGEELFPVTACEDEGKLSASFDGVTMLEDVIWECKQWNKSKAEHVSAGELPEEDKWQVVQQLVVSRAKKCLYMVTDGTEENCVYLWVEPDAAAEKALRDGWALFEQDLAGYTPEEIPTKIVGQAPESLPSLFAEVRGEVVKSNLAGFKVQATELLSAINTDLQTDEDFANADATAKWCKEVEGKLDGVKENVLGQTASIDELFRTIDDIKELARSKRLELERLVKDRKQTIRDEILQAAKGKFAEHMAKLNDSLPARVLSAANTDQPDFAGAMRGKKTVKSLRDAVDQELTRVKLAGNDTADRVRGNFKLFDELAGDNKALFADANTLVFKAPDDLAAVVKSRVLEHEAKLKADAEAAAERERERIRKEEADKLAREQLANKQNMPSQQTLDAPGKPPQPAATHYPEQPEHVDTPSPAHELDEALLTWKKQHNISGTAFNALLQILSSHPYAKALQLTDNNRALSNFYAACGYLHHDGVKHG